MGRHQGCRVDQLAEAVETWRGESTGGSEIVALRAVERVW